jgi:hypothetical protein
VQKGGDTESTCGRLVQGLDPQDKNQTKTLTGRVPFLFGIEPETDLISEPYVYYTR